MYEFSYVNGYSRVVLGGAAQRTNHIHIVCVYKYMYIHMYTYIYIYIHTITLNWEPHSASASSAATLWASRYDVVAYAYNQ